jgi:hypothetical protein
MEQAIATWSQQGEIFCYFDNEEAMPLKRLGYKICSRNGNFIK